MASIGAVTDTISIRGLAVSAVIGVHDWEREVEQTLVVGVDLTVDVRTAAATDDLAEAVDYAAIAGTVRDVLRQGKFRLIETAAERVAAAVLAGHPVHWLRVEVAKPLPREGYSAVVTIERER